MLHNRAVRGVLTLVAVAVLAVAALGVAATGTTGVPEFATAGPAITVLPAPDGGANAGAGLAMLAVKGRAPMTGYSRDAFGQAWTDDNPAPGGHNGCDTRDDVLRRDLTGVTAARRTGCGQAVLTGLLHDPYTGRDIPFTRGVGTSTVVQIDHVVALGDAWATGAQALPALGPISRLALANDPLELLAVDGPTNQAKSDADAATWLPPNKTFRCTYVAIQIAVKIKYGLWVTSAEHDAMARQLATCPAQTLPETP